MECLFSIAPDVNSCGWHIGARVKKLEVKTSWSRRRWRQSTDRTLGLKAPDPGCVCPVKLTGLRSAEGITPDAGLCPVKVDRTRPIEENRIWTLTVNDRTLVVQGPVNFAGASGQLIAIVIWRLKFDSE